MTIHIQALVIGCLVALLFAIGYNALIGYLERNGLLESHVAYSVVGGTAVMYIIAGFATGDWQTIGELFLITAFGGLPMVLGSYWRNARESKAFVDSLQAIAAGKVWTDAHPKKKA